MVNGISGVILAGGANRRFDGRIKSNIIVDGKSIMARMIDVLKDIFYEIIIVTNTPEEFKGYSDFKIIGDQFLKVGPLGGIHAACRSSSNKTLFVFAGDMPILDKKIIVRQIDYYRSANCDILIPQINQFIEPLHAIYNISIVKILEEYLSINQDYAVRKFINSVNVKYLNFEDSEETRNAFTNINSPSDISKVNKHPGSL